MAYKPTLDASPEVAAVTSTSIRAAAIGASIMMVPLLALGPLGLIVAFPIAFAVGGIAVAACLMTLGVAISLTLGQKLETTVWFWIPLVVALTAAFGIAWLFGDLAFAMFILPYAIPAAILYRRDVLSRRLEEYA